MTPEHIDTIRTLRAYGIPWKKIAEQLDCTVQECRDAIGMPRYDKPAKRQPLPWEITGDVMAGQPAPGSPSQK